MNVRLPDMLLRTIFFIVPPLERSALSAHTSFVRSEPSHYSNKSDDFRPFLAAKLGSWAC